MPTTNPTTGFGNGLQFTYTAASHLYTISGDGISLSFGPADYFSQGAAGDAWIKGDDLLTLEPLTWGGTRMVYNRVSYINAKKTGIPIAYACVTGVPTLAFDVPATGTINFSKAGMDAFADTSISGTVTDYSLGKAGVSFGADFTAKTVTIGLHLVATTTAPGPHTDVDLGMVTGSGVIDRTTGHFSGSWSGTGQEAIGDFAGSFFGPQAQEFALAYSFRGRDGSGVPILVSAGAVNGSR